MTQYFFDPTEKNNTYDLVRYEVPEVPEQVRVETSSFCNSACSWCLKPGEVVVTHQGVVPIESILPGDLVLTHKSRWRRVTALLSRSYSGELVVVKPSGFPVIKVTPEHPLLTDAGWVNAGALQVGDRLLSPLLEIQETSTLDLAEIHFNTNTHKSVSSVPTTKISQALAVLGTGKRKDSEAHRITGLGRPFIQKLRQNRWQSEIAHSTLIKTSATHIWMTASKRQIKRFVNPTPSLMFVLGLFVAEGHIHYQKSRRNSGTVGFTFGSHESALVNKVQEVMAETFSVTATPTQHRSTIQLLYNSGILSKIFESWFGRGASNKHIPLWVLSSPPSLLRQFLMGYLAGDGHYDSSAHHCWFATTVSRSLAYQLKLVAQSLGVRAWFYRKEGGPSRIQGRLVSCKPAYYIKFSRFLTDEPDQRYVPFLHTQIKTITTEDYEGPVFNLSVEEDESFTTGLISTHNCSAHGDFKALTRKKGRMTPKMFSAILDDIQSWPKPLKRFNPTNFGELFMARGWFEMLQEVCRKLPQTKIVFSTTGSLWTDENLEKLAQIPNVSWINFSLNAWYAETWERIHKVPAEKKMAQAYSMVHKLRARRPDVYVNVSMVLDSDITTEKEKDIFLDYWQPFGPVTVSTASYANNPNRVPKVPVTLPCRSVVDGLVIFDSGAVSNGCCFNGDNAPELEVGHFPEQGLLEIWHGARFRKIVDLHNSGQRAQLPICKTCSYA